MVKLPTREDLGGLPSTRALREPIARISRATPRSEAVDTRAISQGIQDVGRGIGQVADAAFAFEDRRRKQLEFDTEVRFQQFEHQQKQAANEAARNMQPGTGAAFPGAVDASHTEAGKAFLQTVPEELKNAYRIKLGVQNQTLVGAAQTVGLAEQKRFVTNQITDTVNSAYTSRARLATTAELPEVVADMEDLVDASPLTPIDQDELKREKRRELQFIHVASLPPEQVEAALSTFGENLSDLTAEDRTKLIKDAGSRFSNAQKKRKTDLLMSFARSQPELWDRANNGTLQLDDVDALEEEKRAAGASPEVIEAIQELREVVIDGRPGKRSGLQKPAVYADIMADIGDARIKKTGPTKGNRITGVDASVTELTKIMARTMKAERLGEISSAEAQSILKKVIPAIRFQAEEETGSPGFFGIGGGPEDIYDSGFQVINNLLAQNQIVDDETTPEVRAFLFQSFASFADSVDLEKIQDREQFLAVQQKLATTIHNAYAKAFTGMDFDVPPDSVILPDGRIVTIGGAASGLAGRQTRKSVQVGAKNLERRNFDDGTTGIFIKGTNIRLDGANR